MAGCVVVTLMLAKGAFRKLAFYEEVAVCREAGPGGGVGAGHMIFAGDSLLSGWMVKHVFVFLHENILQGQCECIVLEEMLIIFPH